MTRAILSDYGKLVLRFLKEYRILSVWKAEVVDSTLDMEMRKGMSAYDIFRLIVKAKNNPIMYGPRWDTSRYGTEFWKFYFGKFICFKSNYDENNKKKSVFRFREAKAPYNALS